MKIVIIDNYDSFTFNLYQMLGQVDARDISVFRNDEISLNELKALHPNKIVLSPGPGHPDSESDFGICKDIIKNFYMPNCSVLGVCLGHQGIVQHLGGRIVGAPEIIHGKSREMVVQKNTPIFAGLPRSFAAMRYHSLIALEESFPQQLDIIARDSKCNSIMAVQHKNRPLYGLQFHPESIGTPVGCHILRNFIEKC